jgi:hypothetical protein
MESTAAICEIRPSSEIEEKRERGREREREKEREVQQQERGKKTCLSSL